MRRLEGTYCYVETENYHADAQMIITFTSQLKYDAFQRWFTDNLHKDGFCLVTQVFEYIGIAPELIGGWTGLIWKKGVKYDRIENPKLHCYRIYLPAPVRLISLKPKNESRLLNKKLWSPYDIYTYNLVKGIRGSVIYNQRVHENPIIVVFSTTEAKEAILKDMRDAMNDNEKVSVLLLLQKLGICPDSEIVEYYSQYYWTPEDYFRPRYSYSIAGLAYEFTSPKKDDNVVGKVIDKKADENKFYFTTRVSDPMWMGKFKNFCCSIEDELNEFKEGDSMNTNVFKNTNAYITYCTFIDKLRSNGADMDMQMSVGEIPDITINANMLQIIRALESVQSFDIPEIVDYKFHSNRVTIVKFTDGTYTKCVVQREDQFDPDTGIIYCVVKKMLGVNGHQKFNDILRKAHKAHKKVEKEKQSAAEEKRARKAKAAEDRAKKLTREEKEKRKAIDIQKQAYTEAIEEIAAKKPATRGRKKATKE